MKLIPNILGLWVYEEPLAPLEREEEDGTRTPALCWRVGHRILVHPDRMPMFLSLVSRIAILPELDREEARTRLIGGYVPPRDLWDEWALERKRHREWLREAFLWR